jgi:hypothetical protein
MRYVRAKIHLTGHHILRLKTKYTLQATQLHNTYKMVALFVNIAFLMLICQLQLTIDVSNTLRYWEPIDLWLTFYITMAYVTVQLTSYILLILMWYLNRAFQCKRRIHLVINLVKFSKLYICQKLINECVVSPLDRRVKLYLVVFSFISKWLMIIRWQKC